MIITKNHKPNQTKPKNPNTHTHKTPQNKAKKKQNEKQTTKKRSKIEGILYERLINWRLMTDACK